MCGSAQRILANWKIVGRCAASCPSRRCLSSACLKEAMPYIGPDIGADDNQGGSEAARKDMAYDISGSLSRKTHCRDGAFEPMSAKAQSMHERQSISCNQPTH